MRRPSPATVIALVSLFVALSSSAYAAIVITGKNVKDGSLTGADVQNGSLGSRDVKNGVLSGADIESDSLTGQQIQENTLGTVTRAKLADHAGSANSADTAGTAKDLVAGAGNRAFSKRVEETALPSQQVTPVAALFLQPARYVVTAKAALVADSPNYHFGSCTLTAGSATLAAQSFLIPPETKDASGSTPTQTRAPYVDLAFTTLNDAQIVRLSCSAGSSGITAEGAQLVAVQVGG